MEATIDPLLLRSDVIVLQNLLRDISTTVNSKTQSGRNHADTDHDEQSSLRALAELEGEPSVFTNWDMKDLPTGKGINAEIFRVYISWAQGIVRNPVDVVFVTHICLYFGTSVPSAILLYYRFSWVHGILHWLMQLSYCGSFTLMLHNHIHNNGLFQKRYAWFDFTWPYILEPLMGHTWDSYYYHHVKHHHVENNGPDDLSSTIRYQRDELWDFFSYVGRFIAFIWIELPLYFLRKRKTALAVKSFCSEFLSYLFIVTLARANFYPTLFVLIIPLIQMRIGLMVGNFGQHALVDDVDPSSDFRSSITLIDVAVSYPSHTHTLSTLSQMHGIVIWHENRANKTSSRRTSEQPPLLQRRLAHLPPPQPSPSLARPPTCIFKGQKGIRQRTSPRFPKHRLPHDDIPHPAERLSLLGGLSGAHWRSDRHVQAGDCRYVEDQDEEVFRGWDSGEVLQKAKSEEMIVVAADSGQRTEDSGPSWTIDQSRQTPKTENGSAYLWVILDYRKWTEGLVN